MLPRRDVLRAGVSAAVGLILAACGVQSPTVEPSPLESPSASPSPTPSPGPTPTPTPGPSLREKIAGLLIVGFRGATLDDAPWLRTALAETGLGGVILFDRDQLTGGDR